MFMRNKAIAKQGDYVTVVLTEDDAEKQKQTIRNRLSAAAGHRGVVLRFIRTSGPMLRFEMQEQKEVAVELDESLNRTRWNQ